MLDLCFIEENKFFVCLSRGLYLANIYIFLIYANVNNIFVPKVPKLLSYSGHKSVIFKL